VLLNIFVENENHFILESKKALQKSMKKKLVGEATLERTNHQKEVYTLYPESFVNQG